MNFKPFKWVEGIATACGEEDILKEFQRFSEAESNIRECDIDREPREELVEGPKN